MLNYNKNKEFNFFVENWDFKMLEKKIKADCDYFDENAILYYVSFLFNIGKRQKAFKELIKYNLKDKFDLIKGGLNFLEENVKFEDCKPFQDIEYKGIIYTVNCLHKLIKSKELSAEWIFNSFNECISSGDKILKAYYISTVLDYCFENINIFKDIMLIELDIKINFLNELYYFNTEGSRRYLNLFIMKCTEIRNMQKSFIKKPKVAIGFLGMLRGDWKTNLTHLIRNISEKYEADYFVASWDTISYFPGMNTGVMNWTHRLLSSEFNRKFQCPKEIADKTLFHRYFPRVYKELSYSYEGKNINKKDIYQINNKIKTVSLENQKYLSLHFVAGEYTYYLSNKLFDLMEEYEKINNFKYDYVFLIRIDSQIDSKEFDKKIDLNDIDGNTLIELHGIGGSMIVSKREIAKIYTDLIGYYNVLNKYCSIENPHRTIPYYLSINGIKRIEKPCIRISNTYALRGIRFPNVKLQLKQDLDALSDLFPLEKLNAFKTFFDNIYAYYSSDCSSLVKKYIVPFIAGPEDSDCKKRKNNFASELVKLELPYRVGKSIINIYKHKRYKLLLTPYIIFKITKTYKFEFNDYTKQINYEPCTKLKPIEICTDYSQALEVKNSFTYKLGEKLLKAQNSWYKFGYIRLFFEICNLKK
ncbi:hypothetical protein ACD574_02705 [Campylobacter sp. LH-2024]|uniref:hypothetical protein n=1 Tax=Campylobacter sp. LH-2024 TaxID=3239825 RepID=UPI003B7B5328